MKVPSQFFELTVLTICMSKNSKLAADFSSYSIVDAGLVWWISRENFFILFFFVDGSPAPPSLVPKDV